MKALLLKAYKALELTEMPEPEFGPDEVLVRIYACGICGSDIHGFDGSSGRRIPPLVMGHEAAGIVEAVGERVTSLRKGDRVTVDSMVSCGSCSYCRAGESNLCDRRMVLGVSCGDYRRHGAFAEYVVVPAHGTYTLPENLSLEHAAMVEPVSVAVHAVNRARIHLGDSAAVVGAGMIGLLVVQALRAAGCGQIFAVDVVDEKLEMAVSLGADHALNAKQQDIGKEVAARTGGRGADQVFEVVGHTATIESALASVRKGGTVTLVGNLSPEVTLPLQSVVTREISLLGSCGSAGEYPQCLELMARGAIQVEPLISAVSSLNDAPQWFDRLYAQEPGLLKVLVQP